MSEPDDKDPELNVFDQLASSGRPGAEDPRKKSKPPGWSSEWLPPAPPPPPSEAGAARGPLPPPSVPPLSRPSTKKPGLPRPSAPLSRPSTKPGHAPPPPVPSRKKTVQGLAPPAPPNPAASAPTQPGMDWDPDDDETQIKHPTPAPGPPPPAPGLDWDPDDDETQIRKPVSAAPELETRRSSGAGGAEALAGKVSSRSAAPAPAPPKPSGAPLPPPSAPADEPTLPEPMFPPAPSSATTEPPAAAAPSKLKQALMAVAALLAVALIASIAVLLTRGKGSILVTVSGPNNKPVEGVQVFINGKRVCTESPCRISDLKSGAHKLTASAPAHEPSDEKTVDVESGKEAVLNVQLAENRSAERAQDDARARVVVRVQLGQSAEEADVYHVENNKRWPIVEFPAELELSRKNDHRIIATKDGFEAYEKTLDLTAAGETIDVVIDLEKKSDEADDPEEGDEPDEEPEKPAAKITKLPARLPAPEAPKTGGAAGRPAPVDDGRVNVNSIPPSSVTVNGRPVGSTPKTGITVKAGPVTAVFVHPELGRMVRSGVVKPGGTLTLAVRFNSKN